MITALPSAIAVTTPLLSTVAILSLFDDHVTVLSAAFSGWTVAMSCVVCPISNVAERRLSVIEDTGTPLISVKIALTLFSPVIVI